MIMSILLILLCHTKTTPVPSFSPTSFPTNGPVRTEPPSISSIPSASSQPSSSAQPSSQPSTSSMPSTSSLPSSQPSESARPSSSSTGAPTDTLRTDTPTADVLDSYSPSTPWPTYLPTEAATIPTMMPTPELTYPSFSPTYAPNNVSTQDVFISCYGYQSEVSFH